MQIEVNGIRLNYEVDGREGAPWVTFVTGVGKDSAMWHTQVSELENDFRTLRLDWRGHGRSQAIEGDYTVDMLMGDLLGVWDAAGVQKSHLVGIGLGGAISIGIGIRHSDRLLSLTPTACRAVMVPELAAIWPALVKAVRSGGMEAVADTTVNRWFTEEFRAANPDALEFMKAQVLRTQPMGYFGCVAAFMSLDFAKEGVQNISVPTLFISGAHDHLGGPPDVMRALADEVIGAKHVTISGAAHICNVGNPIEYNRALGGFLKSQL